jgi:hypothetical protein
LINSTSYSAQERPVASSRTKIVRSCFVRNREIILSGFAAGPAFLKQPVIARSTARCLAIQHRAKLLIGKN